MPIRIYLDTSIVGGYFDIEFKEETHLLFERLLKKEVIFVLSDLLDFELRFAPKVVKELLNNYDQNLFERVYFNEEVDVLAHKYIEAKVVGKTSIEDCRHIALATISNVDVLASWNFKHIVNYERIQNYNHVNINNGYKHLEIRSPKELINYDKY